MRNRLVFGVVLVAAVTTAACIVDDISGPSAVPLNGTATFQMTFHMGACPAPVTPGTGVLLIDAPAGWRFQSASFSGNINGVPTTGVGELVSPCNGAPWGGPSPISPPGYTRFCVQTPTTVQYLFTDSVRVSVSLVAGNTPGRQTLRWYAAASALPAGVCVQPEPTLLNIVVGAGEPAAIPTLDTSAMAVLCLFLAVSATIAIRQRGIPA